MTANIPELVFALIGTLGGGGALIALLKLRADKRKILAEAGKTSADAAAVIQGSAVALLTPLHDEIGRLRGEVDELRGLVRQLSADLEDAHAQLRGYGGTPPIRRIR
jgi:hypothetical protein